MTINLQEYKLSFAKYQSCARNIQKIIEIFFESDSFRDIHVHKIEARAKNPNSLEKKLQKEEYVGLPFTDIKDLVGARIIFFYNQDRDKFINSKKIEEIFDIDNRKLHYPDRQNPSIEKLYTAYHYIGTLKNAYLNEALKYVPAYECLRDIKIEIQIHTLLDHAFSETSHDITYKKSGNTGDFARRHFERIEERFIKIKGLLDEAGRLLNANYTLHQSILNGKKLIDENYSQKIMFSCSFSEIITYLTEFYENALPYLDEPILKEELSFEIIEAVIKTEKELKNQIEHNASDEKQIFSILLKILNQIRYDNSKKIFDTYLELYKKSADTKKEKILENINELAAFHAEILKIQGFRAQNILLEKIKSFSLEEKSEFFDIILLICKELLNCSITRIKNVDNETFHISQHMLTTQNDLKKLRNEAIEYLKNLLISGFSEQQILKINEALYKGVRFSAQIFEEDLCKLILQNQLDIINIYHLQIKNKNYKVLIITEEYIFNFFQNAKRQLNKKTIFNDSEIDQLSVKIICGAESFYKELNVLPDYETYKILFGDSCSVFSEEWINPSYTQNRDHLIENINIELINDVMLLKYLENADSYFYFGKFLKRLIKEKPDFIFNFVEKNEDNLFNLPNLVILGLLESEKSADTEKLLSDWLDKNKNIELVSLIFLSKNINFPKILTKVIKKAIEIKNENSLIYLIGFSINNYPDHPEYIQEIFFPALKMLTNNDNTQWVEHIGFHPPWQIAANHFNAKQCDLILKNLLSKYNIDCNTEEILKPIANRFTQKVLQFFGKRIKIDKKNKLSYTQYVPIPFSLHRLCEDFIGKEQLTLDHFYTAYQENNSNGLFRFHAGKLIQVLYPKINDPLRAAFFSILKNNQNDIETSVQFICGILQNYDGTPEIFDICKEMVSTLPEDSKCLNSIELCLKATGVVSGKYGSAEAHKKKFPFLEEWKKDKNKKISAFSEIFIKNLEQSINFHNKFSDDFFTSNDDPINAF